MSGQADVEMEGNVVVKLYGPDGKLKKVTKGTDKPLLKRIIHGIVILILIIPVGVFLLFRSGYRKIKGLFS